MKKIKVLKDDKDRITGYIYVGENTDAIEIDVEDDFVFTDKPINYKLVNNKIVYEPNLEEVKKAKREELKTIREEKISENLVVNGDEFQVKEKDLQNFYNLKIVVDLDSSKANEKINWVLADNKIKEFSYSELMNVLTTYILRKQDIFTEFGKISIKLESLKTVEEIENLKWS